MTKQEVYIESNVTIIVISEIVIYRYGYKSMIPNSCAMVLATPILAVSVFLFNITAIIVASSKQDFMIPF